MKFILIAFVLITAQAYTQTYQFRIEKMDSAYFGNKGLDAHDIVTYPNYLATLNMDKQQLIIYRNAPNKNLIFNLFDYKQYVNVSDSVDQKIGMKALDNKNIECRIILILFNHSVYDAQIELMYKTKGIIYSLRKISD